MAERWKSRRRELALAAALLVGGCASPTSDWHLAPFATHMNGFDGGTTAEFAGGIGLLKDPGPEGGPKIRALRPILSETWNEDGTRILDWFPPLGRTSWRKDELVSYFFPFYTARSTPNSGRRKFMMLMLPGILYTQEADETNHLAILPFYGDVRDFATFDRIRFVLFPLYMRTVREKNETDHALFPVFSLTRPQTDIDGNRVGNTEGWRVWPLYGQVKRDNSYDRRFVLWPVGNFQTNHLERPEEKQEHINSAFPLFTQTKVGTYRGYTFLWPLFGYATDPREDFIQVDAPFPLVRYQRGGKNTNGVERTRFWPFYSHLKADLAESTSVMWPLITWRHEDYFGRDRDSLYMLPFWRSWTERIDRGEREGEITESWRKFWPLWSQEVTGPRTTNTVLPLNPLMKSDFVDFHWGWIWQLYRSMEDGENRTERGWLGLWWREKNAVEDRKSFTGLWSRRTVNRDDMSYTETSLLFGLIRWRSSDDEVHDSGLMRPAFPGPGWPAMELPKGGVNSSPTEHEHLIDLKAKEAHNPGGDGDANLPRVY